MCKSIPGLDSSHGEAWEGIGLSRDCGIGVMSVMLWYLSCSQSLDVASRCAAGSIATGTKRARGQTMIGRGDKLTLAQRPQTDSLDVHDCSMLTAKWLEVVSAGQVIVKRLVGQAEVVVVGTELQSQRRQAGRWAG